MNADAERGSYKVVGANTLVGPHCMRNAASGWIPPTVGILVLIRFHGHLTIRYDVALGGTV
jgi:hypothetical protein